ncbi:MAG: hypothetical protein HDS54_06375 [Barnesiella sp.]|nr:hypothetical protein [Barnesiella sp.]
MKKVFIGIVISLIFAIIFPTLIPWLDWGSKLGTLYAVSGIMFSIGMSLIVTSSFSKIKNSSIRHKIENEYDDVRNTYICEFIIVSILYMFYSPSKGEVQFYILKFTYVAFVALSISYSILFFILNFIELQKLNKKIDELLNRP